MKKLAILLPILLLAATVSFAQFISLDVVLGNRPPNPQELSLMQIEERRNPEITRSMHDIENAIRLLRNTPDTFGGHKNQAQIDLHQALMSLRKALYFRIWQDTGR